MINDLKPYSAYKDSGSKWLGSVPQHWSVQRQRNVVEMRVSSVDKHSKEGEYPVRLCNYVDVYKNDRITERLSFMNATATKEELERFKLEVGDVLITKDSEAWSDIGVPALVGTAAPDLVCGYHIALLRSRHEIMHGSFLFRSQQSLATAYQYHVEAHGVTRYGLSHDAIKSIVLAVPSLSEQSAIVHFLGHADHRIQRYIQAKKKMIALLNEQKQVVIQRAVTRGLDPNVCLSPSGIEWLGDIPEHWKLSSVKRLARAGAKTFTDGDWIETPYIRDEGVRLIQTGNVGVGDYREKGFRYISEETFDALGCTGIESGDVLICRLDGPVGRACLAPDLGLKMITSVDNAILKVNHEVDPRYVVHLMSSPGWLNWIESICRAGGGFRYRISRSMLGDSKVPLPPIDEQCSIADAIEQELSASAVAISRIREEIDLLLEYRARLIADVVTGKLDVREVAARLPDEETGRLGGDALTETEEGDDGTEPDADPEGE